MAITKEIKIHHINVQEYEILQISGHTIIKEGDDVISQQEYAFGLVPTDIPAEIQAYNNLPDSEKIKVDKLTNALWDDDVKKAYTAYIEKGLKDRGLDKPPIN
jgi:hypothetical protein